MPKTTGKNAEGGVVISQIPYLPLEIPPEEIAEISVIDGNERAFLLDKNVRNQIENELKDKPDGRYVKSKKGDPAFQLKTPSKYSVIKYEGDYYILAGRAGAGAYGVVKYAQNLKTGEWLVLKTFSEKHQRQKGGLVEKHEPQEINYDAAEEFKQLVEAKRAKGTRLIERKSPSKGVQRAILMENARGMNLQKYLDNLKATKKMLTVAQWLELIKNVCAAVDELHKKQKKLHRDLKLENFMIDPRTGKVSLIDLGLSTKFPDTSDGKIIDDSVPGNRLTMAPETKVKHEYTTKSDVFGVGVTIATMFEIDDYDWLKDRTSLLRASDEGVVNNKYINDKDAFREIRFLVRMMMGEKPDTRPQLREVTHYISQYQKKIGEQVTIGIVLVDDYRKCNAEEKAAFVEKLKKFDEVILIDTNPDGSVQAQIKLARELDKANINASNRVFKGSNIETVIAEVEKTIKADSPEKKYNLEAAGEDLKARVFKQKWAAFQSAIVDVDQIMANPKMRLADRRVELVKAWQSLEQMKNDMTRAAADNKAQDRKEEKKYLAEKAENEKLRRDEKVDVQAGAVQPLVKADEVAAKKKAIDERLDVIARRIEDLMTRYKDDKSVSILARSLWMALTDRSNLSEFMNQRLPEFHELIQNNTLPYRTHATVIEEFNAIDAEVVSIRNEMVVLPQLDTENLKEVDEAVKRQMAENREKLQKKKVEPVVPQNQATKAAAVKEVKDAELQKLDTQFTKQINELARITGNLKGGYWQALNRNLNDILTYVQRTDVSQAQKNDYIKAHMNLVKTVVRELAPAQPESAPAAKQAASGASDSDADFLAEWNKIKKALSDIDTVIKDPAKAFAAKQKYLKDSWSFLEVYKDHMVTGQAQIEEMLTPDNDAHRGAEAVFRMHKELELAGRGDEDKNAGVKIHQIHGAVKLPGLIADIGSTLDQMIQRESDIETALMAKINELRRKGDKSDVELLELLSSYNRLGKIFLERGDYKKAKVILNEGLTEISKIIPGNDAQTLASLFTPLAAKAGEGHPERNGFMAVIVFQKALTYEQLAITNIKNNEMDEVRKNYNNAAAIFVNFPKNGDALFNSADNEMVINRFGSAAKRVVEQAKSIGSARMNIERQSSDPNIVALKESLALLEVNANKYRTLNIETPELNGLIGKVELMIKILSIPQLPAEFREKALYRFKLDASVTNTIKEVNGIKDESMKQGIWFDAVKGIIRSAANGLSSQLAVQAKQEILSGAESGKRFVELQTNLLKSIDGLNRAVAPTPAVEKKAGITEKLLASQKLMKTYVIQYEQRLLEVPALKELIDVAERLASALADPKLSIHDKEKALYGSKFESLIKSAAQELNGITVEPFKKGIWFDAVKINLRAAYSEAKNDLAQKAKSRVGLPPKVEKREPRPAVQEKPKEQAAEKDQIARVQSEMASVAKAVAPAALHKPEGLEIALEDKKQYLRQLAKQTLSNVSDEAIFKLRQELDSEANKAFLQKHSKTQNIMREALLQSIIILASLKTDVRDQLNMFENALSDPRNQAVLNNNPDIRRVFSSEYQESIDRATQDLCNVSRRLFGKTDDLDKTEQWRQDLKNKYNEFINAFLTPATGSATAPVTTEVSEQLKAQLNKMAEFNAAISAKLKSAAIPSDDGRKVGYDDELIKMITERNLLADEMCKQNPKAAAILFDMRNLEAEVMVSNNSFYEFAIKASNLLSRYVESEILSTQDQQTRIIVMERWISIMQKCFEVGDFQSVNAILFALNSSEFDKIPLTKNGISEHAKLILHVIKERCFRPLDANAAVITMQTRDDHLIPYSPALTIAIDKQGEVKGKQARLIIFSNIEKARQRQKVQAKSAQREDSPFQKAVFAQTQTHVDQHYKAMKAKTAQLAEYQELKPLDDHAKSELVNNAKPGVLQSKSLGNMVIPEIYPWMHREHELYQKWKAITDQLISIPDELDTYRSEKLQGDQGRVDKIGNVLSALLSNELPPNIDWKDRLLAIDIVVNNKKDGLAKLEADKSKAKVLLYIKAITVEDDNKELVDKVHSVLKKMLHAYQDRERFDVEMKSAPKPKKTIDTISIEPKVAAQEAQPAQVDVRNMPEHPLIPGEQLAKIFADLSRYQDKLNSKVKADEFRKTVTKAILDKLTTLRDSIAGGADISRDVQILVRSIGIFQKDEKLNKHLHFDFWKKRFGKKRNTTLATYLSELENVLRPAAESVQAKSGGTKAAAASSVGKPKPDYKEAQIEQAEGDGNCAFNAFILGCLQKFVFDQIEAARTARGLPSLDQDNEFREKFIIPAAATLRLKQNATWTELKAEILKRRNGSKNEIRQLQKALAPIMRSLSVELGTKNTAHMERTVQSFISAFADYVNSQLHIPREGRQVPDDIFRRHAFIIDKFETMMPEFVKDFTADDVRNYNKLRRSARTAEERSTLASLESKYTAALDKVQDKLQVWWTVSQNGSRSGYNTFMDGMKQDGVFAGDLELMPLARFFGVNLDVIRPALDRPHRMNSANGAIPVEGMDEDVIKQLVDRQVIDRPDPDSKVLVLNEATSQQVMKRLEEVPDYTDVLKFIEMNGAGLKRMGVPSHWSKDSIDELRIRDVIEYKDSDNHEAGFRFSVDPEVALARISKMENSDKLMDTWRKYYSDAPTVVLSNESAVHWNNVIVPLVSEITSREQEQMRGKSEGPSVKL